VSGGVEEGLRIGVAVTAFGLGLRHGIDWDHLAAITDLTSSAPNRRRGMIFSMLYAGGHALVVLVLGLLAIALGARLPTWADVVMERIVGLTLVALAVWVVVSLVRHGRDFTLRSRWSLIASMVTRLVDWLRRRPRDNELVVIEHEHTIPEDDPHGHNHHDHGHSTQDARSVETVDPGSRSVEVASTRRHVHVGRMPSDPFTRYGSFSAFGVGMLHGIGAETPTQIIVLGAAAGASGGTAGVVFLAVFLAGLFCSNTLVAVASLAGILHRERAFPLYAGFSVLIATFSLIVGLAFLLGQADGLPALLGG